MNDRPFNVARDGAWMMRQTAGPSAEPIERPPVDALITPAALATIRPRHGNGRDGAAPAAAAQMYGRARTLPIIQRTWAQLLGVQTVGPDDDFFDLGGNSLMVAASIAKLSQSLGIELLPRALFEAPTPAEMADLIEELPSKAEDQGLEPEEPPLTDGVTPFFPDWVVPLQLRGRGRPVFVFPGGMGGRWTLLHDAKVAAQVGHDHPFYGFRRDDSHLDRGREDWITATASDYADQIRTLQGRGPYLLYGVCAGGPLAWEAAHHLVAAGEQVAGVLFYEVSLDLEHASIRLNKRHSLAQFALWGHKIRYVPQPLAVDLTLLMTEGWQQRGRSDGWEQIAGGRVETVVMPGDTPGAHNLYAGRVETIAGHLREWIAKAEARALGA